MLFRKASVLLCAAVLATSAFLTSPPGSAQLAAAVDKSTSRPATEVSGERIVRHIQFLASDKLQGRRTGTPAADEAAAYIAKEFQSYGLEPASTAGFLETFDFVAGCKLGAQNRFRVQDSTGARELKVGDEFMPLAFSSGAIAEGEVVFVQYGISAPELQYDNYKDVDAHGKIVMILRGSPDGDNPHGRFADFTQPGIEIQNKTLKAREKGARGIIFVSEEKSFSDDRLSRLRHDLNFLDAGIPVVSVNRRLAAYLLNNAISRAGEREDASTEDSVDKLKKAATSVALRDCTVTFKTDVVKINGRSANVAGVLKGSDPKLASEYVVIGAHYDHLGLGGPESLAAKPEGEIHHGADDNASGTSGLLELARSLAAEPVKPKRSIVFIAFSGEEMGLLGSSAYAKKPAAPLASTVAMLNMDMIGRLRQGSLFIGGVGTSPTWKPLLEKLNQKSAPASAAGNGSGSRFQLSFGQDGFGPSDHQSFYVHDVPVLFFFTGTHDDYHKPTDTADKINSEGERQVVEFVREAAIAVADEPGRIAFTKVKTEPRPTGRGFRVYLGTVPNYSDQSDGMKLDGVRPGSPAERAGLRAGDIVVKLGKTPIKNVYDYTYALGEMRGGEEVEVLIRRDGRETRLKITPEKRQ
ncbi:MAG TPA: M20/M25/M40 family metallo-hydrolase [Blastocatellia bacterium]|nr:M20/M25/M40 family metallo-hydrolase [Blastocatellia bacterium]